MIRPELQIMVTPLESGAAVRFPKDHDLIKRFRARFPKALWGAGTKSWHIPGKLAARRAYAWAAEEQPRLIAEEQRLRDIEWEAPAPAPRPVRKHGPVRYVSVASQYVGRSTHPMPPGEYERIEKAIADLSAWTENSRLFGFLNCRVSIWLYWPVHPDEIEISVGPGLVNGGTDGWTIG